MVRASDAGRRAGLPGAVPRPGRLGPVNQVIALVRHGSSIRFQDERPSDYWAARGYDWYAGL